MSNHLNVNMASSIYKHRAARHASRELYMQSKHWTARLLLQSDKQPLYNALNRDSTQALTMRFSNEGNLILGLLLCGGLLPVLTFRGK